MGGDKDTSSSVMILASGGSTVGWGHVMRCSSIAEALRKKGTSVSFAAFNDEVAALVASLGFDVVSLDVSRLSSREDAKRIKEAAINRKDQVLLVDSYDVCQTFFQELHSKWYRIAYIDDLFLYKKGRLESPAAYDVDVLINYGFAACKESYSTAYSSTDTCLLIGLSYAPVRPFFSSVDYSAQREVKRVLLTSGSTNPGKALEKMILGCKNLGSDVSFDIVVGRNGSLDIDCETLKRCVVHKGVNDLSALMQQADIAVSSAGSTLYELACIGVPTIALPVVDNQLSNARGFLDHDLGYGCSHLDWDSNELSSMLHNMVDDYEIRRGFSVRMQRIVDGMGAKRIANALICPS